MSKHFEEMSQLERIDKKMKFKIVGRNGETKIKEVYFHWDFALP